MNNLRFPRQPTGAMVVLITLFTAVLSAGQAGAKDGRGVYDDTCVRCHGLLQEQTAHRPVAPLNGARLHLAVVTPQGPTLNGIVGRPAGIIAGYKYSKGMRAFADRGAVWDRETLDAFLTNSRKYVKGTFMILKLGDEDRTLVLDYLEEVARYRP